jgi:hypothetical protein
MLVQSDPVKSVLTKPEKVLELTLVLEVRWQGKVQDHPNTDWAPDDRRWPNAILYW